MELLLNPYSVVAAITVAALFWVGVRHSPLGPLSLPAISAATSFMYFFFMPVLSFEAGETLFLGLELTNLESVHVIVALYSSGVAVCCWLARRTFSALPPQVSRSERAPANTGLIALTLVALTGVAVQLYSGRLNIRFDADSLVEAGSSNTLFFNLAYSLLLPVTVLWLIRKNFSMPSLAFAAAVGYVFLSVGFRFRLALLIVAAVSAYLLIRRRTIGALAFVAGTIVFVLSMNIIGASRTYFAGIDVSRLADSSVKEYALLFGGEIGPVYSLMHLADNPPPDLILIDPWVIAIGRLVPSFIWPGKPVPTYLGFYQSGFPDPAAEVAGIAAPQQAEMLLQFGLVGIPLLAALYTAVAIASLRALSRKGRDMRIAGQAIIPALFGFYMQQRGYFFQVLSEYLVTVVPLLLISRRPDLWQRPLAPSIQAHRQR